MVLWPSEPGRLRLIFSVLLSHTSTYTAGSDVPHACADEHWDNERIGACTLGVHTTPGGGTVFTAASTDWAHGLVGPEREAPP